MTSTLNKPLKRVLRNLLGSCLLGSCLFGAGAASAQGGPQLSAPRYALIIGVSDYDSNIIADLKFASRDAYAIAAALLKSGGYQPEHIVVMTTDQLSPDLRPTLQNVRAQLETLRMVSGAESLMVFFSGHGSLDETGGVGENMLWTVDANLNAVSETGLKVSELTNTIRKMKGFRQHAILMDACRNRLDNGKSVGSPKMLIRLNDFDPQVVDLQILYSTAYGHISWEDRDYPLGQFTAVLVEGLLGAADGAADATIEGRRDNQITLTELQLYIKPRLSTGDMIERGMAQIPALAGEQSSAVVIAPVPRYGAVVQPPEPCPNDDKDVERAVQDALDAFFEAPADETLWRVDLAEASWTCAARVLSPELVMQIHQVQMLRAALVHDELTAKQIWHTIERMGRAPTEGIGLPREQKEALERLASAPAPDADRRYYADAQNLYINGVRTPERDYSLPAFEQVQLQNACIQSSEWLPANVRGVGQTGLGQIDGPISGYCLERDLSRPLTIGLAAGAGVAALATLPFAADYAAAMRDYRSTKENIANNEHLNDDTAPEFDGQWEEVNDAAKTMAIPGTVALGFGAALLVVRVTF
jgi:uncharacterized caspase-like protein